MRQWAPTRRACTRSACLNDGMPDLAGISHIDLTVTDVDRSERFYTEVLGFDAVHRVEEADFRLVDMRPRGLDTEVCVRSPTANDGSRFDEYRTGLDHLSFRVAS